QNYVNRVVGDRPIGKKVFFQGGVAFNKSVVAAFEKYLDRQIIVPPHHDVTGAIGMALIAKRHMKERNLPVSSFKGFDLSKRNYAVRSFECKSCDNLCEVNRVTVEGEKEPLYYGSRCEKYDVKRRDGTAVDNAVMPDLFAERAVLLEKTHNEYIEKFNGQRSKDNGPQPVRLGIPRIFFFHDFLPFWSTLLWELGFEVVLSSKTNRQIINKGVENILTESCFPHKIAHGHVRDLLDKGVDAVFLPSFINFNSSNREQRSFACPYAQTMPYIAQLAFSGAKFLKPVIDFECGDEYIRDQIHDSLKPYHISGSALKKALEKAEKAQKEFSAAVKTRGMEILGNVPERTVVILGRAYNAFDPGINLEIPKKLASLGVFSIPMDYLPTEMIDISGKWSNMYWRSGQNILKAAEIIRDNPKLFGLYIGNFSCGPDSFIHRFFNESMAGKPYLHIEIDEHSADAGVITRCEAFLDSISGRKNIPVNRPRDLSIISIRKGSNNKIVYIPRMSDHVFGLAAAFEACGLGAEVMDRPDAASVKLGRRYVSGKECYPCAITTGDMVSKAFSTDFDPDRAVFFMPSGAGPCRFGQYNILHRLVLNEIGFPQVPIYSPNQDESFYSALGMVGKEFSKTAWKGVVAVDLLMKCLHETRPYELNRGESDALYIGYLDKIYKSLKSGNGAVPVLLSEIRRAFSEIPKGGERRPLIGIIGEIFVRHNVFANEDIIRKIEALGGEVWLAPAEEWICYVNAMGLRKSMQRLRNDLFSRRNIMDIINNVVTGHVQGKIEHEYSALFKGYLRSLREPSTREVLKNAAPYVHDSFEGETVLSMGKAVDFVKNGASGIISAMPFGCMPGTIVNALLKGLKNDYGIPCLSVAYDGVESTCSEIQLEAFMHQAAEYKYANRVC
ncbi:MAG: acyl-CoA dehydratase activase-related protein, partial [Nitrospirota bacterium]|nr:acyl-CoA dehydratase activase-related protein [Nitrospirota bacterium]